MLPPVRTTSSSNPSALPGILNFLAFLLDPAFRNSSHAFRLKLKTPSKPTPEVWTSLSRAATKAQSIPLMEINPSPALPAPHSIAHSVTPTIHPNFNEVMLESCQPSHTSSSTPDTLPSQGSEDFPPLLQKHQHEEAEYMSHL
ncbi:hypothetical protein DSO57_1025418 [Entomophthora muscae]|uniref:Uncharacterized protein n=1 Tax=Entomophthora muscae TaxID=34485 RepID=A0ACC2T264_9FUNG|nr:hypothetical protein DSO57_1025418 [Entomophthora muscae]